MSGEERGLDEGHARLWAVATRRAQERGQDQFVVTYDNGTSTVVGANADIDWTRARAVTAVGPDGCRRTERRPG